MSIVRNIYGTLRPAVRMSLAKAHCRTSIEIQKARLSWALRKKPRRHYEGKTVAVVGLFSTRSGLGRGAELIARSIEMQGASVVRVDVPWDGFQKVDSIAISALECERHDFAPTDLIVVANPPAFFIALSMFSTEWLRHRTIISHWVWEIDVMDRDWKDAVKICDEIWVSSEFVAQTLTPIRRAHTAPLKVVPYPIDVDPVQRATVHQKRAARQHIGIPDNAFVVGYSFAASSNYSRKNPIGAVAAFRRAFPKDDSAILIIRALDGNAYTKGITELRHAASEDPRIRIIEVSSDLPIAEFYAAIDVYLSPARSEGYGLNIAEATQAGHPAIAVEWSLSQDVLRRPGVIPVGYKLIPVSEDQGHYASLKGASWADPDIEDMAKKIASVRRSTNHSYRE